MGLACWIAPRNIIPGANWGESIITAIESCTLMILIFSSHSNSSMQVMREVERAVNKNLLVIPFRIENVLPSKSLEYFLSASHWLDAFTAPLHSHINELVNVVQILLRKSDVDNKDIEECTDLPPDSWFDDSSNNLWSRIWRYANRH
jgi:hypothetical protein